MFHHQTYQHPPHRQHGATLYVVIVLVMLTMLLALWASRTSIFTEMIVGNDADYQRAFEAAQALLQDAELDIRNEKADGTACSPSPNNKAICRTDKTQFPTEEQEISLLIADLDSIASGPKCRDGICAKRIGKQDFWNNNDPAKGITLAQMEAPGIGARYGQYTGATVGENSNPILADRTSNHRGGWYWIEVMRYEKNAGNNNLIADTTSSMLALQLDTNVVFRITSIAHGLKPNTMVILQQTYARKRLKD